MAYQGCGNVSPWRYLAVIVGLALSGFGALTIVAATIRPTHGGALIVVLFGVLFLALGVTLAVSALVVNRGERAYPPRS